MKSLWDISLHIVGIIALALLIIGSFVAYNDTKDAPLNSYELEGAREKELTIYKGQIILYAMLLLLVVYFAIKKLFGKGKNV